MTSRVTVPVRFSEVDSMGLLWHGHFIKFFEDGREAFGKKYGVGYLDMYRQGFVTPLVDIQCQYKAPVRYEDEVIVETALLHTKAARIEYRYRIHRASDGALAATGTSTQVFTTAEGELCVTVPAFYEEWKREQGLLDEG